jgi:ABC-type multidrug transport system fused ATPase/permease subunit
MIQLLFNFIILSFAVGNAFRLSGASKKVVDFMKHVPDVNSKGGKVSKDEIDAAEIEFKNVTFAYPSKKDVNVSDDLSLKIEKNKVVALVGQSGCGKSSVISLIERYYKPQSGSITFNGVPIEDLDPRWLKKQISIVS